VVDPQGIILDGHEWMAMRPRQIFNITRRALGRFFSERSWRLAAGVTFFTLFAVTPLLLLVAAVGGLLVDRALLQEQFTTQLEGLFGSASAEALREMVRSFRDPTSSISAFVLAGLSLIFGATNAFGHLRHAINVIWGVREPNEKFQASFFVYVGVLGLIILMLLSTQVISSAILMAESVVPEGLPLEFLLSELVNIAITGTLIAILCAIVYRFVPDTKVTWPPVLAGAAVTMVLFMVGKYLFAFYLTTANVTSGYGAFSSVITFMMWIYFSVQMLLIGAAFARAFSEELDERSRSRAGSSQEPLRTAAAPFSS
jgi:membrane protein